MMKFSTIIFSCLLIICNTALAGTVTTTNDTGAGSLRQAIADASSGETITFTNSLSGQSIVLTSGQITVNKSLSIDATGLNITMNGNHSDRIFEFTSGTTITLTGLTLTNAYRGSIFMMGTILTVSNCTLSGNSDVYGGAISAYNGTLTLYNTTLSGNSADDGGGGIYNVSSTMTINDSSLIGNSANEGGGIYNRGSITMNNSTLSGNTATTSGGGIENTDTLTINNCTLSDNSAQDGGGINDTEGSMTINNSTFTGNEATGNGGGIRSWWSTLDEANNCTLVGNSATYGGGIANEYGTLSLINTIVVANTAEMESPNIYGPFFGTNNLTNEAPLLAPLGNYGGVTQTMPPLPGSPAIDAGTNTVSLPYTDQRGYPRVINGIVDIGACEFGFQYIRDCSMLPSGMRVEWIPVGGMNATVMYSTNLVDMPFTDLSATMAYPLNIFTDTVNSAEAQCFYKVEMVP
jgi:hypothetical protein